MRRLSSDGARDLIALLAPLMIGLVVHGMYVGRLGLYWDDGEQFMQGLQAADGNILRFIVSDTFGYLRAERPVAHFLLMMHRAAFACSVSALHWSLVAVLVLNALVAETIARRIVKQPWFVFAVGVIFVTYPLAPLQTICSMLLPHLWACLLALLASLCAYHGLSAAGMRRLTWYAVAAMMYIASLLTHEVFALLPPAFVSLYLLRKRGQTTAEWYRWGRIAFYKPALWLLSMLVAVLGLYGLWRVRILPMYGTYIYPSSEIGLNPVILAKKVLAGTKMVLVPWPAVLGRIAASPPPFTDVLVSAGLFAAVWLLTLWLFRRPPVSDYPHRGDAVITAGGDSWVGAPLIGLAFIIAAVVAVGVSPAWISIDLGATPSSRANFVATVGVAWVLPALLILAVRFYHRSPALAGVAALLGLVYAGSVGSRTGEAIFSHESGTPVLFGRYSLAYGLLLLAYVLAVIFVTIMTIASCARQKQRGTCHRGADGRVPGIPHSSASLLSGAVACLTLVGVLLHFSIKAEFATEWRQQKTMMEQLRTLAPAVKDNTFIVLVRDEPGRSPLAPYSTHWELSSYCLALYDNWTIMANTDRELRFYPDGIESTYYGTATTWFPPGVRGPALTHATLPTPRVGYDHLLLFAFDGSTLRMLSQLSAKTTHGDVILVHNNPDRILDRLTPKTAVWRHVLKG